MGLALGKCLWELDQMPADEWRTWCRYHATQGLPDLQLLFGHLCWVVASVFGDGKNPPALDDFLLRPRPSDRVEPTPMNPDDAAEYFARLMGSRVVDMRRASHGQ